MSSKENRIVEVNESTQTNSSIGNVSEKSDGSLANMTNEGTKRAFFSVADIKQFKSESNPSGWTPVLREICVDENGIPYFWAQNESGEMVIVSAVKTLIDEWTEMKKLGIINNAEAFRLNGKIYNFIFDNEKMVLRLNTELDIYSEYKFYRVRKTQRDPKTGDYVFITGIRSKETGEVVSNLGTIIKEGERYIPSSVSMIETCVDGQSYIVEFFDENRTLIGSQVYYARSGISLDFSLSPDMAIKDLIVNTDRPHDEENACFLYQNEDPNSLIIRVGLKYVDGKVRDVTEEGQTTGRLKFEGRDSIDTTQLTADPSQAQQIKIIYFVDVDNVDNPGVLPEDMNQLDSNILALNKVLKVYIVENIYDPIIDVVIHGFKETKAGVEGTTTDTYKIKVFTKYESGVMRDITPVMDGTRFLSTAGFSFNSKTGCLESTKILTNFQVEVRIPQGRSVSLFSKTFFCEFTEYNKRMSISRVEGGFDTKDTTKMTLFNANENKMKLCENDTLTSIKENYSYKYKLEEAEYYVPTHVIVRNALKLDVIYTGNQGVDSYTALENVNGVISYSIPDNNLIFEDMPLLIEFYRILLDEETGARKEIFLTHIQRTYAKSTSNSLQ